MFGKLKTVDWVSKINPSENRKSEIRSCFGDTSVEFHYPDNISEFNVFIDKFQKEIFEDGSGSDGDHDFKKRIGEKKKFDKFIVMEDVSCLEDKSSNFSNFLTVPRNFRHIYLYIFHLIYPTKSIWH